MAPTGGDIPESGTAELADSRHDAEHFINAVPSILIGLDARGRITRWNEVAAQTFGLTDAQVLGLTLVHCGIKWLTPDIEHRINSLLQSERRSSVDDFRFQRNEESRLLGLTFNWIRLPRKRRGELLIIGSDITEK